MKYSLTTIALGTFLLITATKVQADPTTVPISKPDNIFWNRVDIERSKRRTEVQVSAADQCTLDPITKEKITAFLRDKLGEIEKIQRKSFSPDCSAESLEDCALKSIIAASEAFRFADFISYDSKQERSLVIQWSADIHQSPMYAAVEAYNSLDIAVSLHDQVFHTNYVEKYADTLKQLKDLIDAGQNKPPATEEDEKKFATAVFEKIEPAVKSIQASGTPEFSWMIGSYMNAGLKWLKLAMER